MRKIYLLLIAVLSALGTAYAQVTKVSGPEGSGSFGQTITVLTNGNYVLSDPDFNYNGLQKVGAVYLYNGITHELISTLRGSSANDRVGAGGVTALLNGNFLVGSFNWSNGSATEAGAVTWVNGENGLEGVVSTSNSLTGSKSGDQVGGGGIMVLPNGNYLVRSFAWANGTTVGAGAVTWGNGEERITGIVSEVNSLVGSRTEDRVGGGGIIILPNGNYLVRSSTWANGTALRAGAVTWGNGEEGITGVVSEANSLVGSRTGDQVGGSGIMILPNGNYLVGSWSWANGTATQAGAVTWCSGTEGGIGKVSVENSLVGSHSGDMVGAYGVQVLEDGNYVVISPNWSNGTTINAGAVTWCNGEEGAVGEVSVVNSLVGSKDNDQIGSGYVSILSNGNYVVASPYWDNGSIPNVGAITWCNGQEGLSGEVSTSNSLVGTKTDDNVGSAGVRALTNGNYVVNSPYWNNGIVADVGAVTWCNGEGQIGEVNSSNSLVGSTTNDRVGLNGVTVLPNGNYVVSSTHWSNGMAINAGATTWGSGELGVAGEVSAINSLIGSKNNDYVGWITVLENGNYVVNSPYWSNGIVSYVGAVTWGSGEEGISGLVSASNSLIGSKANDWVGFNGIKTLPGGSYVVRSAFWSNGVATHVGAVTWGDGSLGVKGEVSASNSLVGSTANDDIGDLDIAVLANGNYVIRMPFWDNGSIVNAGAITWSNGKKRIVGVVSAENSLVGVNGGDRVGAYEINKFSNSSFAAVAPSSWDNGSIADVGAVSFCNGDIGLSGTINTCSSIVGTVVNKGYFTPIYNSIHDYYLVGYYSDNAYFIRNGNLLASDNTSISEVVSSSEVVFANDCARIAALRPTGSSPVSGSVTAKVYDKNTAFAASGQTYVRRYHAITPAVNENTATGKVTLYYTQTDFDDYNTNRETNLGLLPEGPSDNAGKANLRIAQQHGTSTTGNVGSYTGWAGVGPANVVIDPSDEDIFWNSIEKRWEVSFVVTGFSGFFAHSLDNSPLPVTLVSFKGKSIENAVLLEWKTTNEIDAAHFEVERSTDGKTFNLIGKVKAAGTTQQSRNYAFTDSRLTTLDPVVYYRLKSVDTDGSFGYSRMISVHTKDHQIEYVFPNPVASTDPVTIETNGSVSSVNVLDSHGRKVEVVVSTSAGKTLLNLKGIPSGIYLINYLTAEGWQTLKLVVE